MRTPPAELAAEWVKDFNCLRHLFIFEWSTTQYWIDFSEDVKYGGIWYRARDIKFPALMLSATPKVDSIKIDIDDVDHSITNIIEAEDIKDKPVTISVVALNKSCQVMGVPWRLFYGRAGQAARPQGSKYFSIDVYNDMIKWKRFTPRHTCSATCVWDFKDGPAKVLGDIDGLTYSCKAPHMGHTSNRPTSGANWSTYWELAGSGGAPWIQWKWYIPGTCRYAGDETTCDKSWDRCAELENTDNFGGKRWLTWLQEKILWWGRVPTNFNERK